MKQTKSQAMTITLRPEKKLFTDNKCVIVADSSSNEEGDLMNYKGIYFNDDPNSKFTCPETGAHF